MTSSALIEELRKVDPTGETQVCIGNCAITYINVEPYYYDGKLQIVEFGADGRAIRGWRATSGNKIVITSDTLRELAANDPSFEIIYKTEKHRLDYEHSDKEESRWNREIEHKVEMEGFQDWVFQTIQTQKPVALGWVDRIKKAAEDYFSKTMMGRDDPNSVDFDNTKRSWRDQRELDYADSIHVEWDNYSRIIIRPKTEEEKQK